MSSDRDALLAAVLANPDDDVPRLVYADYLEEAGGEANVARARFIRAEVTAEQLPEDDPERERLESLAARQFNRYSFTWNSEIPGWDGVNCGVTYRRGFAADLSIRIDRFISDGNRLFAAAPFTALRLRQPDSLPRGLTRFVGPDLSRITTLQVGPDEWYSCERIRLVEWVLEMESLSNLHRLILSQMAVGCDNVQHLIAAISSPSSVPALTAINLSLNRLGDAGASYLAAARGLVQVQGGGFANRSAVIR